MQKSYEKTNYAFVDKLFVFLIYFLQLHMLKITKYDKTFLKHLYIAISQRN